VDSREKRKAFEYDGYWWGRAHPDQKCIGTFRFDEDEGGTLRLMVPPGLESPQFLESHPISKEKVIVGVTIKGRQVTLIDCFEKSSRRSLAIEGGLHSLEIYANMVIDGFHCNDDPLLSTASVSLSSLHEWYGTSGISINRSETKTGHDLTVQYTSSPSLIVHEDGRFKVSLRLALSGPYRASKVILNDDVILDISADEPKTLSEFDEVIHACQDFLSIATLSYCERTGTLLKLPNTADEQGFGTYHAIPVYKKGRDVGWLFRPMDTQNEAPEMLSKWLCESKTLREVRELYFAGIHGKAFIAQKFLFLAQAVEAFHQRYYSGEYMEKQEFEDNVLSPLVQTISSTSAIEGDLQKAIKNKLKFANKYSLHHRLRELVKEHKETLEVLVDEPDKWVGQIVDMRNKFTHFSPQKETEDVRKLLPKITLCSFILRLLIEACFMQKMGFEPKETVACIRKSGTHTQMARKFRDGWT